MFERIKIILSREQPASTSTVDSRKYDYSKSPVTDALVRRGKTYQAEAEHDLRKMLGRLDPISKLDTIEAEAASCSSTIAHHITIESLNRLGRSAAFLPLEPLPKDGCMIVAFSLFVLAGIHGQLKSEKIDLNFQELAINTTSLFFITHPDEKKAEYIKNSFDLFRMIIGSDSEKVKEWHNKLMELIPLYILQWTTDNKKLREIDFMDLFSEMLASLLKTIE